MELFDRSELMGAFLDEVEEQLQLLEQDVLRLEQQGESPEILHSIFRVAHTLKGSSAAMGFEEMKNVTHEMENVLDTIRNHLLPVTKPVVNLLFQCLDQLRQLRDEFIAGSIQTNSEPLIQELRKLFETKVHTLEETSKTMEFALQPEQQGQIAEAMKQGLEIWICEVEVDPDCEMKLARAFVILNQIKQFGDVVDTLPKLDLESQDSLFGHVSYLLITDADAKSVESETQQIVDVKRVKIRPYSVNYQGFEELNMERLNRDDPQTKAIKETRRISQTIRVNVERLERLMNLVGELVIDQTRIAQVRNILQNRYTSDETIDELEQISNHISRVVGELQESMMKTRMLPIEQLFNKFPRMVRDLSDTLGKEVNLVIEGQETELDRTVIEEIGDPLIHLIRNALDHGIEKAEVRKQAKKPVKGTLRITASHQESQVVLTVEDDGAGIDPEKVKQSAIRKELITGQEAEGMTKQELIELIFYPGFSTAKTVSDISGRGVGMDIVRSHIEKLNGLINVETRLGEGTKYTIKLPLTLAILTGLLIKLNGRTYALPMSSVVEIVRIPVSEINSVKGQAVSVIRDKALPLIWLHDHFGIERQKRKHKNVFIVVLGVAEKRLGLVVDELIGNQEIVVKSIGSYIGKIDGISGATILGDGSVSLILDVIGISKMVENRRPILQEVI
ncbi:chemotaxis protein CheW [Effusibacillus consociatus]|uniref:Chemotaxis protein CheA n=1 Tax=Effusibacillus consociatus TaxID=1117041 RepID=A0ABV9Q1G7_9BACL